VFDHVTIRASDRAASERFYELVLSTLAIEKTIEKTYTGGALRRVGRLLDLAGER
jgi:catechol 2,3-dioxygenase-like lactoylglutathione lyase family enzyme